MKKFIDIWFQPFLFGISYWIWRLENALRRPKIWFRFMLRQSSHHKRMRKLAGIK